MTSLSPAATTSTPSARSRVSATDARRPAPRPRPRPGRWLREHLVVFFGALGLLYLFVPIFVVVLFSFNQPTGRFNYTWVRFSTNAWAHPCAVSGMCDSLLVSIKIGVLATLTATLLGTLAAFALGRHRFRGRAVTNVLIFLPMATPEVVAGSSLLTLFINIGVPLGQLTIFIAHVMFCVSFVIVTVKARLAGMDPRLEQAAMDLYANRTQTFLRVTLPLVLPGIVAAALLSFSLSFDDFIITNFNSGSTVTFPMFVWGAYQRALPVQVNVIGTAMLLITLVVVGGGLLLRRRRPAAGRR
ncbi:ABC transporter permease [Nakamurella endophytica]|uniref:ABC transporter permease n=1 Tax=Nakamurella endophytica TaxID=1748367 RepID=A0A917TAD8_9ACTN|nr:ABC transporter permease [Nakamurella endophytica]GGM16463.1 ABC transporter permease [Nakamurella endophytica]